VCILSDSQNGGEELASELEKYDINIVEKEVTGRGEYLDALYGIVGNGAFDSVLLAVSDPVGMGILLNKRQEVRAAVCSSGEDIESARDNGANVIILGRNADLRSIAKSVVQLQQSRKAMPGMFKLGKKDLQKAAVAPRNAAPVQSQPKASKVQPQAEANDLEEEDTPPPQKGIIKKIKYALGIEDEGYGKQDQR